MSRIPYTEGLIQSCEKSLKAAFAQPTLRLSRRPAKQAGDFTVEIDDPQRFATADVDSAKQPVADVLTPSVWPGSYYFAFKANFVLWAPAASKARAHILDHASITVFQELAAGELGPCFRADWDPRAVMDSASDHAQPHWHFVQRPDRLEGIVRTLIAPTGEFSAEVNAQIFTGLPDLDRFHFAMSPLWDPKKNPSQKISFDSSDFEKWFDKLAQYIATQLAYICTKSRSTTATVKDFIAESSSEDAALPNIMD